MPRDIMGSYKLILLVVLAAGVAQAQNVFNCASFATTGDCSVAFAFNSGGFAFLNTQPSSIVNGQVDMVPSGTTHIGASLWFQTLVNVQAFSTTFTFIPNGFNFAFVIQNEDNNGSPFSYGGGAGAEGGFSQFAAGDNIPTSNVFALEYDSFSSLTNTTAFSFSSAQIYQTFEYPAMPATNQGLAVYPINKISTSPVALNSPSGTQGTTTGDLYSSTITYDGNTISMSLFDVTAGGSCPGSNCFTQSWSGVYIPSIVAGDTAVVGFTSGIGETTTEPLLVGSFAYTVDTPTGTPSFTAWNANSTFNDGTISSASPVYSEVPGSYSGPQTISITTSTTPNNYICYELSAATPEFFPQPNNNGGCVNGTLYSGPITISSTATLYAMAGSNNSAFAMNSSGATGLGPPSTLVAGTYTISSAPPVAAPLSFKGVVIGPGLVIQ
jgi:hypothetical protein